MDLMVKSRDRNAVPLTQNSPTHEDVGGRRRRRRSRSLSPHEFPFLSPRRAATCFSVDGISGRNEWVNLDEVCQLRWPGTRV